MRPLFLLCLLLAGGCGEREQAAPANAAEAANETRAEAPSLPPAEPIPPGQPGGLPDDRTPVSEAPFSDTSAQGAANVVQAYFALIETGRWEQAKPLWRDKAAADAFAAQFTGAREVHGQVGAPGTIEGAAGSSYVDVPVQIYGRRKEGTAFAMPGTATLRRVNDVPGSSEEQRKWHISGIELPVTPPQPGRN